MSDRIVLRGLRGLGRHGVYDEERSHPQPFRADIVLQLDLAPAARSDDVGDTVHYGELATQVVSVLEGEPVNLVETLAERIAALCLQDPRVRSAEVTVHKPEAPVGVPFDDVAVTIVRSRS